MSWLPTLHPRRAVGLAALLGAAALLVSLKSATAPSPRKVSLTATAAGTPASAVPGRGRGTSARPRRSRLSSVAARRNVLGAAVDVGYGTVQVRVDLAGSRIVDVTPMQLPAGGRSSDISSYAAPQLRSEVLTAQSAHIDTVSGASYTSDGYARSLQSALDAAHR